MTNKKGGKAFIVVGGTGMGKSTFVKNLVSKVHPNALFIYDVNAEYTEYYNAPLLKFPDFCTQATNKTDSLIVFEEASIFLSNRGSNAELIEILVRKRHTRNVIVLVFHSIRTIPKYIMAYVNYFVMYKTVNDTTKHVEMLDIPEILKAFTELRDADFLTSPTGHKYSPSKILTLSP